MLEDGTPSGGQEANYCSNCGLSLEPQAQFCPDCGTRREPPSASPAPRPADAGFSPPASDVPGRSIPDWGVPSIFGPKTLGDLLGNAFRIYAAAFLFEVSGTILGKPAPLTRDFITIGRVSYFGDTRRGREELIPVLQHPTLEDGLNTLQ